MYSLVLNNIAHRFDLRELGLSMPLMIIERRCKCRLTDTDTDTLLKTYATNVRKYRSTMTVTDKSSTLQHYNVKRHQLTNECLKTLKLHCGTRSPAIAEGPRDAGVPVEIW